MNAAIEFHDSEVASVKATGSSSLCVRFSAAYVHRSAGVPGVDSGLGYLQGVEFELEGVAWSGSLTEYTGTVLGGSLMVNGAAVDLVPLPYTAAGDVRLTMQFSNEIELEVVAEAVRVTHVGEARYVERFGC